MGSDAELVPELSQNVSSHGWDSGNWPKDRFLYSNTGPQSPASYTWSSSTRKHGPMTLLLIVIAFAAILRELFRLAWSRMPGLAGEK